MSRYGRLALSASIIVAALSTAGVASAAEPYGVVFTSVWSSKTHPVDFPSNPHFSPLIGGTHDPSVEFWTPGALASDGIESMAETGSPTLLAGEVEDAIGLGSAESVIQGDGMPLSPGAVGTTFMVSESHPLVTLVTMVAPSPDWFVGVHGLDLRPGGQWVDQLVVDLYVYDAGTDSGEFYTAPNEDTQPPEPVALLESGSFAESGYVGTFTFTRLTTGVESGGTAPPTPLLAPVRPNPTAGVATISFELPERSRVTLDVFDVAGRRMTRLADGVMPEGPHVRTWNGRLADGASAPAGVYLVRLRSLHHDVTRRIVLAR